MDALIHIRLRRPEGMSSSEFFGVWKQEAAAGLAALEAGVIKHIWKVPGKYEVLAVISVDSVDQIDEAIHRAPIWKLGYEYIADLEWTLLRPYENWAKQLEKLAAS